MNAAHQEVNPSRPTAAAAAATTAAIDLQSAVEFIWLEADLLDAQDYAAWLALWTPTGHYVIPLERHGEDHAARLNVVYDDHAMRVARTQRLTSGYSMSASPSARTARTVSRFKPLQQSESTLTVRCAQHLLEYKYDRTRMLGADVTYTLVRTTSGIALDGKVVRLLNCDDALFGIGYLL